MPPNAYHHRSGKRLAIRWRRCEIGVTLRTSCCCLRETVHGLGVPRFVVDERKQDGNVPFSEPTRSTSSGPTFTTTVNAPPMPMPSTSATRVFSSMNCTPSGLWNSSGTLLGLRQISSRTSWGHAHRNCHRQLPRLHRDRPCPYRSSGSQTLGLAEELPDGCLTRRSGLDFLHSCSGQSALTLYQQMESERKFGKVCHAREGTAKSFQLGTQNIHSSCDCLNLLPRPVKYRIFETRPLVILAAAIWPSTAASRTDR